MSGKYQPMVLSQDNPFREQIERSVQQSTDSDEGMILNERVVITRERQYIRGPWVRLTQDRDKLAELSPWACKVLIHIALSMNMNQERIRLNRREMGLDKRMFSRVLVELLSARVIAKTDTREWYWINIGILIMGSVNKHE